MEWRTSNQRLLRGGLDQWISGSVDQLDDKQAQLENHLIMIPRPQPETNENQHQRVSQHIGSPRRGAPGSCRQKKMTQGVDKTATLSHNSVIVKKREIKILDFKIEAKSAVPVYEQIKQAVKLAIISGYLREDDQLMSIRELGARLQIHPNTISKVYYQLETEGFVYSRQGTGYFVKVDHEKVQKEKHELLRKVTQEYISKVTRLGYSPGEMLEVLKKMLADLLPGKETKTKEPYYDNH